MEQSHVLGTGSNYRTPVKLGTRQWKDWVSILLLGRELRRCELLKHKDAFDTKDQAKVNQSEDIDIEDAPIASSSSADDWQDVVEMDDITTRCIYILTPPPYKQWYSRHVPSQGPRVPKKHNLREDAMHQYNEWKKPMPSLIKPKLDFLSKTSGKPSNPNMTMPPCNKCNRWKTSPLLCLFWDCVFYKHPYIQLTNI